jgi:hypothetical protein
MISSYDPSLSFLSALSGAVYLFPCWGCDVERLYFQLKSLTQFSVKKINNLILIYVGKDYEYIVVETNDVYVLQEMNYTIKPQELYVRYFTCNTTQVATLRVTTPGPALVRYLAVGRTGIQYRVAREINFTCNKHFLLIASQQICIKCGLDSYPRIIILLPTDS